MLCNFSLFSRSQFRKHFISKFSYEIKQMFIFSLPPEESLNPLENWFESLWFLENFSLKIKSLVVEVLSISLSSPQLSMRSMISSRSLSSAFSLNRIRSNELSIVLLRQALLIRVEVFNFLVRAE